MVETDARAGGNPTASADAPARDGNTVVVSNAEIGWRERPDEVDGMLRDD
jgi:hypothetical protein